MSFSQTTKTLYKLNNELNIKVASNSSIIYPGFCIAIENPFIEIIKEKNKKSGKVKSKTWTKAFSLNLNYYYHKNFHSNIYSTIGYHIYKKTTLNFSFEYSANIGISRTIISNTSYKIDKTGQIVVKKYSGYVYCLAGLGSGISYNFAKKTNKPISVYTKLNINFMFPYNNLFYFRPALEVGIIYNFKKTK